MAERQTLRARSAALVASNGFLAVAFGAFIGYLSLRAFASAHAGRHSAFGHALVLAPIEAIAAVLLMFRKTRAPGGAVLLAIYTIALVISALGGDFEPQFLVFAAITLHVVLADRLTAVSQQRGDRASSPSVLRLP